VEISGAAPPVKIAQFSNKVNMAARWQATIKKALMQHYSNGIEMRS